MENNIVKVCGCIRVSTEGQVKKGYSLSEQQAEIERHCREMGFHFVNGMFELLDVYERLEIALKLKRGRLQKAKSGGYFSG